MEQPRARVLERHLSGLQDVVVARRGQLRLRLGMMAVIALCCAPTVGWPLALAWTLAYLGLQVFETVYMRETRSALLIVAILHLNSWVFGAFAMSGPVYTGPWGLAGAVALLAGALINTALSNQRSTVGFAAAASPFALYLAALPIMGVRMGGNADQLIVLVLTSGLLVAATVMLWRSSSRALAAESAARANAEAADAAKSAFVAMVSHELRTPISAMMAGAEAIGANQAPTAQHANKQLIVDAARMMRFLLNDLLDHSKLEAGRMSIEEIPFDLRRLVRDTVRFWRPEAHARGLKLRLDGARHLPRWIAGDPTRIRQVLNNLFSNALKFTDEGFVSLGIQVAPSDDGLALTLTVSDTGAGMSDAQAERVFRPFAQADATIARTHGGTGLGLTISRDLARLMGGDLSVASVAGEGSAFAFSITVRPANAPADAEPAAQPDESPGLRILVADDHDVNRRAFNLLLAPMAERVVAVADGLQAVEAAGLEAFDLVLLDLNMPRMNGLEAARRLRDIHGPDLRIVALTASVSPSDVAACLAAGMDAFVAKPVETEELYRVIGEVLAAKPRPAVVAA
jgi:signal transduction histidine kinase/ActR/RegA family two-component response regulator